jgi:hypothetical protein
LLPLTNVLENFANVALPAIYSNESSRQEWTDTIKPATAA